MRLQFNKYKSFETVGLGLSVEYAYKEYKQLQFTLTILQYKFWMTLWRNDVWGDVCD